MVGLVHRVLRHWRTLAVVLATGDVEHTLRAAKRTTMVFVAVALVLTTGLHLRAFAGTDRWGDPLPPGAVLRLGTVRWRHEGGAGNVLFSPDGKMLATCSFAGVVHVWDAASGKELRRLSALAWPSNTLGPLAFSPDAKHLAAVADEKHVVLWDVASGTEALSFVLPGDGLPRGRQNIQNLRFSPDGKVLAVAGGARQSHVFDTAGGKLLYQCPDLVGELAFAPDGETFIATAILPRPPKAFEYQVWSTRTGTMLRRFPATLTQVRAFALSPDGKAIAAGGDNISLLDARTGKVLNRLEAKMRQVEALAFSPDGRVLVAGGWDSQVHVWDLPAGRKRQSLNAAMLGLRSIAVSPDGKTVAAVGGCSRVCLWDLATGRELFTQHQGHDAPVNSVAWTPDGKQIVSGGTNGQMWVRDAATGEGVRQLHGDPAQAIASALSPDGRRAASAQPFNKVVHLWDGRTGAEVCRLSAGPEVDRALSVAFTHDSKTLLLGGHQFAREPSALANSVLCTYDAATGRPLGRTALSQTMLWRLACSPDGRTLAAGGATEKDPIVLWDLQENKEILTFDGRRDDCVSLAFSPDGRTLVSSGHTTKAVRLWEVATGKEIFSFRGHTCGVIAVAFSPDGRVFASASGDHPDAVTTLAAHEIRFWDAATGTLLGRLASPDINCTSLAFSPDGSRLASGMRDTTVLVWQLPAAAQALRPVAPPRGPGDWDRLWADLAGEDVRRGRAAVWALTAAPHEAVAFLKARLEPMARLEEKRLRRLLAQLDSDRFASRQAAYQELESLVDEARPALRRALDAGPSPEVHKRLQELLGQPTTIPTGDLLRGVRAIEALERIGTPEARQVLGRIATGSPGARLTREAAASLARLGR
jgi:WD40 repeat protein